MKPVAIAAELLPRIYAQARAEFPAECCGYLRGPAKSDLVDEVVACHNAHEPNSIIPDRSQDTAFAIDGRELLAFVRSLDTDRPAKVIYHSHTNGRAYFSDADRRASGEASGPYYPVQHLVVGVTADRVVEAALFGWDTASRDFVELARWAVLD
jgi:[CysO sulfur-carrier protein]-S-L-cysteine hydrolase